MPSLRMGNWVRKFQSKQGVWGPKAHKQMKQDSKLAYQNRDALRLPIYLCIMMPPTIIMGAAVSKCPKSEVATNALNGYSKLPESAVIMKYLSNSCSVILYYEAR